MAYILGLKTKIRVDFDVVTRDTVGRSGQITSSPIEDNTTVSDHFAKDGKELTISGVCIEDAAKKLQDLDTLFLLGERIYYSGRSDLTNLVITKFDNDNTAENSTGFDFSMTLSSVKISYSKEHVYGTATSTAQTNKLSNTGVTQPTTKQYDEITEAQANALAKAVRSTYKN